MTRVELIASTKPNIEELKDITDFIAYTARVSNPANQLNTDTSDKLIKYLIKHKHWSPFEMASVVMQIVTTRDIAHQILRHRSFSFQEFSQRYAVAAPVPVLKEARFQDPKNRQSSIELTLEHERLAKEWLVRQQIAFGAAQEAYQWALSNNIAKEVARSVLPEGMTESTIYMAGTVRSWIHYIELRSGPETQKEHREVAQGCARELAKVFGICF